MITSDFGIKMIMAFEGFPNGGKPYICPAGVRTQGYGHTAAAGGEGLGGVWTKDKAAQVLADDLRRVYEPGVSKLLKREADQGEFDALVSFAFNCGVGALAKSSVLKFFNRGEHEQAASAFGLWVKAAGKTSPGLVRRRSSEALAYQGFMDADFDGAYEKGEPIYGEMPQAVEPAREKMSSSGTLQGVAVAGAGGTSAAIKGVQDALTTAEPHISAGTWIGIALGVTVLAGAAYAGYRKWTDMGRPLPWGGA